MSENNLEKKNKSKWERCMPVVGFLMLASEICKQWILTMQVYHGRFQVWYFPFQLCSLPMYLCILILFVPENWRNRIRVFLMTFSLLGGIAAYFDTTGMQYPLMCLTIHSYIWHLLVILIGIWSGTDWCKQRLHGSKDAQAFVGKSPSCLAEFTSCLPIWLIGLGIATLLNVGLWRYGEINMFYISPMEPSYQKYVHEIAMKIGIHGSNILYLLAMLTGACTLFGLWMLGFKLIKKKRKKAFSY